MNMRNVAAVGLIGLVLSGCAVTNRMGLTSAACAEDLSFPIYFADNSDALSAIGLTAIESAARRSRNCAVAGVSVTGLADASGDAQANLALSSRRAAAVSSALAAEGITAPLDVRALGDTDAVTANGRLEPMQRRTEVTIHYNR